MIEEHRVADYFVTVGLNNLGKPECDYETLEPITDLAVIFKSAGEEPPDGFECIETTPSGLPANLNHGSLRSPTCYLCFRRGRDKPPLTDIGVLHEGRQRLMHGCDIVLKTPSKLFANVNNASNSRLFITYRRASPQFAHSSLAVIDICVIITNKGEKPPHAFCLIDRNLNQGLGGSAVYLCYRKSLARTNSLTYSAGLKLSQDIITSNQDVITSNQDVITSNQDVITSNQVSKTKILSTQKVLQVLQVLQNYKDQRLVAQTNKCICLLSRYPFFDAFRRFLMALYRISVSGKQNIPIERYISHFMHNVPFPTPRKPRVFVQMTHEGFEITEPSNGPLPVSGASYTALLRCLGTENTLTLLACILTEQKILVHSLRPALLTSVGEALTSLIFPFQWKCPYIPLCPLVLADVLSAPFPFIYGIDSRYFDQGSPPCDVTCVDLDTNMITQASETRDFKQINWKSLPKKPCKVLKDKLDEVFLQLHNVPNEDNNSAVEMAPLNVDSVSVSRKENIEVDIQEAFLRFHAQILQGYDQYLLPITSRPNIGSRDLTTLFDLAGFMKSRPRGTEKFFQLLTRTQLFNHFVEIRSLSSSNDAVLMFFDECIDKCDTPARLLHNERFSNSYNGFPKFKPELFIQIPSSLNNTSYSHLNTPPRSPVVGRTKHEREQGSVSAKKQANSPMMWARCLLGHCYTIWFIQLPAFVKYHHDKKSMLYTAFDILQNISKSKAKLPDEVCFRVLMQLSGQFNHPALAVKVLFEMKRIGLQPNAVTWGYYHRAILEGEWQPEELRSSPQKLWNKARIVFSVIHAFKKSHKDSKKLVILNESEDDLSRVGINPIVNTLIQLETESVGAASDGGYSSELLSTEDLTRQQPVTEYDTRKGVYNFYIENKEKGKKYTVDHFEKEKIARSTIYDIIKRADDDSGYFRRLGSEKKALKMTQKKNTSVKINTKSKIKKRKKKKIPHRTDDQKLMAKTKCGRLYRAFSKFDWIIDDESYFTLSHSSINGNDNFYTSDINLCPSSVKYYTKRNGLAINQKIYLEDCIKKRLIPFIKEHHQDSQFVFWPDLATSHYANSVQAYLNGQNVRFVPKEDNPANVPEARPIEDFCSIIKGLVYKDNWQAENLEQLRKRIVYCSSKVDINLVQEFAKGLIEFGEEPKKSLSSNNIVSLKKHIRNLSMSSQISDNEIINQIKINKLKETSRSLSTSMVDSQTTSLEKMWNNNLSLGSSCPKSFYVQKSPISLEAVICSSQICSTCDKIIYDEEVMGAWSADDSNLNILAVRENSYIVFNCELSSAQYHLENKSHSIVISAALFSIVYNIKVYSYVVIVAVQIMCPFCQTKRVPMLEIKLKDYSQNLGSRNNIECKEGCVSNQNSFSLSSLSDSLVSKVPSEKETSSIQQLEDFFSSSLDQLPGTSAKPASVKHESALNSLNTVEDNFNACSSPSHSSSGAVGTPQRPLIVKHRKTISNCSTGVSSFLDSPVESESCSVPYLSPLVLRKEVENLLENNGDHVLQTAEIVKEKPILFWNMVWYFRRLALPSHLPMLLSASRGKHISLSSNEVVISTSWDMNRQTNSTVPLYMLWNLPEDKHYLIADHNWTPYNTLKTINLHVQKNDIMEPIKILLEERSRQQKENPNLHWSLYRELMFLSLVSCGEDNIDIDAFDREYKIAYKEMHRLHSDRLYPDDKSPTVKASFCRKAFQPPTLQPRNPKLILM
uniref:C-myc promoter-binding protein n=1 Tax=Hydra vulgaris TaxID=6087 RepID=T2MAU0_HYDVU